jgi:hypothetical protein
MLFGMFSFCFDNFSMSPTIILPAEAKDLSFSSSREFKDLDSGQKKMLISERESGSIQQTSQFQIWPQNEALGLKDILTIVKQGVSISLALSCWRTKWRDS